MRQTLGNIFLEIFKSFLEWGYHGGTWNIVRILHPYVPGPMSDGVSRSLNGRFCAQNLSS